MRMALLAAALVVTAAICLQAQGGPPMITDDTGTVPKGHFEINTAFTLERGEDGTLYGVPLIDFNYGLSRNTQLKVEIPWLDEHGTGTRPLKGLGNTNIGVRWRFRDETEHQRVAMSVYPAFEFNNPGSVRRGIVEKGPEFLLPIEWQTKVGKYGVGGDVGYRFKRGADEVIYGVIVGRQFGEAFELLGEIHGTGAREQLTDSEVVYNFGTRIRMTSHLNFLFSAGRSIRRGHDPRFINFTGVQITF